MISLVRVAPLTGQPFGAGSMTSATPVLAQTSINYGINILRSGSLVRAHNVSRTFLKAARSYGSVFKAAAPRSPWRSHATTEPACLSNLSEERKAANGSPSSFFHKATVATPKNRRHSATCSPLSAKARSQPKLIISFKGSCLSQSASTFNASLSAIRIRPSQYWASRASQKWAVLPMTRSS